MSVLNLSVIDDDRKTGVLCKTSEQVEMLVEAVRQQRQDVSVGDWVGTASYIGHVYFLNYRSGHTLQHGDLAGILSIGLKYIEFDDLVMQELPEFEENQTGILSLLGL